jgi:hypothetical protein
MNYIYTHRGRAEHIEDCMEKKCIPMPKRVVPLCARILDHSRPCIWVSKGRPTWWTYIFSGCFQFRYKSYIVFETEEKAKTPNRLKMMFFHSQKVFEHDICFKDIKILEHKIVEE